ncbi:unnamed protein product [Rotaria sp. Silwood1]|nr:unnamed protein product [Rotaria sp. Silwood1]CAF1051367.1 unnamed protein product [Rotaria sp. Silwood1]CAF1156732.1 unnamed protein product [Rotaria sp. Silwood1]CAF3422944.1 unnamed protein product [Rotaria sp. Silwood1]CAF3430350.1 unnamed protein product [Rotaria sp. Silwood1]
MNLYKLNDILPHINDKNSCLEYKCQTILVPLPPSQIGKPKTNIKRILEESSNEITKKLNGFLLAIGKIHLLSDVGQTFQDEPTLWVPVRLNFVIFVPERGRRVRAIVSKLGKKHIACLIHSRFNASFHRDTIPPVYHNFIFKLGQPVLLEIIECDVVDKILDIKTTLVEVKKEIKKE